jgi:hypothetical protein
VSLRASGRSALAAALVFGAAFAWPGTVVGAATPSPHRSVWPIPARVSGIVRLEARGSGSTGLPRSPLDACSLPGDGNWITDCATGGQPVNETSIAYRDGLYLAGANDYNSYNTNAQLGFFWSTDGVRWHDDGPLDLFPHAPDNGAGDPGLAIDPNGVGYYSAISFSYTECEVGGLELLRRDPNTGTWAHERIAANTANRFNDKPAIALDEGHVYQAWTEFDFCPRQQRPHLERLKVAISSLGPDPEPALEILTVPGALHTEGASIAADGSGGFWLAWEEFKDNLFTRGQIRLIHHDVAGWSPYRVISPRTFHDLPIPLPRFRFTTNSFPALAVGSDGPKVVWCGYDTGVGRAYLWSNGSVRTVKDSGGDQFFPAIVAQGRHVIITFSETDPIRPTYDQYLIQGGVATKVSTKPSVPNQERSPLDGFFIGDYSSMVLAGSTPVPMWTDVRSPYFAENTMVFLAP